MNNFFILFKFLYDKFAAISNLKFMSQTYAIFLYNLISEWINGYYFDKRFIRLSLPHLISLSKI
jgi:hypothetical protein